MTVGWSHQSRKNNEKFTRLLCMHNCYSVGILHKDLFALAFGSCRAANKPIFKTQSQTKRKLLKYTFKKGLVIDLVSFAEFVWTWMRWRRLPKSPTKSTFHYLTWTASSSGKANVAWQPLLVSTLHKILCFFRPYAFLRPLRSSHFWTSLLLPWKCSLEKTTI